MARDPKTMNKFLLALTVLSVGLQDIAAGAVSPAIYSICMAFPEVSTSTVQLVITLPTLSICIVAPLYGWLSNKIQPRKLIIFGLALFVAAGCMPVFLDSLPLIMLCRVLLGVGTGITMPSALSIIPVFYSGKVRDKFIGFNQGVGSLGCIFMQAIGGYFADVDWHLSFLAYAVGVVSLVLVVLFLPDIPMDKLNAGVDKSEKVSIWRRVSPGLYGLTLVFVVCMIFVCIPTTNLDLMIQGKGIGTAASTGLALSVYTVGSFLGSVAFGYIKKACGIYTFTLSYLVCGAGFLLLSSAGSMGSVFAAMVIAGLGMGCLMCAYIGRAAEIASSLAWVAFSIALVNAANGFGNFIHPTFVGLLDGIYGNIYGSAAIRIAGGALVAMGLVVGLFYLLTAKKRRGETILQ
jgi:MFS family permease